MVPNVAKRNVFAKLPFLGSTSFQIRKKLQKLFSDKLTSCNLKIVFTSPVRVKSFFTFKDKLPKMLLSGLFYMYVESPNLWTFRHFTSHWKKVNIDRNKLRVIQEHILCCNYSPVFEDFSVLTRESNNFKLKKMQSLLIARDQLALNKADSSLLLELL